MSLYPPPATIKAELFTRTPDQLRKRMRTAWSDFNKAGQSNLWVTDIPHGRAFEISPAGDWTQVAEYDRSPARFEETGGNNNAPCW